MPSSGPISSLSSNAVIPEIGISDRVTVANTGLYTCPPNKKARVSGSMVLDAVGADATYAIAIKRGSTFFPVGQFVTPGGLSVIQGVVILDAGDILTNVGDSGSTNGTCDMDCTVQEISV